MGVVRLAKVMEMGRETMAALAAGLVAQVGLVGVLGARAAVQGAEAAGEACMANLAP